MPWQYSIIFLAMMCGTLAEDPSLDRWIWTKQNRRTIENLANRDELLNEQQRDRVGRSDKEREPTTARPRPGSVQNDEIEDYPDVPNPNTKVNNRNYPQYPPIGLNSGQQLNNFNYPLAGGNPYSGNTDNGILVGPGGPTGIIGRPQQYFPGNIQSGFGGGGFGSQSIYPSHIGGYNNPNVYSGIGGQGVYPQNQGPLNPALAHYPGGGQQINGGGFYSPGSYYNQGGHSPYPTTPNGFIGQFPAGQFNGQVPNGNGPTYTEGYGLANANVYPGIGGNSLNPYNSFPNYGFDEYDETTRKLKLQGKNAALESKNSVETTINDKINKSFSKI